MLSPKVATLFLSALIFKSLAAQPQVKGEWSDVIQMPIVPVAAANLPNGKVLTWSAFDRFTFGGNNGKTYTAIFDPATNQSEEMLIQNTAHDMFCPGINNLPDGRILVAGGSSDSRTSIYNPFTDTWSNGGNMNIPRGYQGNVTLPNGAAFTIGGSWSGGLGNKHAEIWTPANQWQRLTGIDVTPIMDGVNDPEGVYREDNHVWLWVAPNGKVFHAGPSANMHWLDTGGNGSYTNAGARGNDGYSMCGITAMYDIGKILKAGGASTYSNNTPANNRCFVIDINTDQAVVTDIPDMSYARVFHNSVVLPTGEIIIFGGADVATPFSDQGFTQNNIPEMYDPGSNTWTQMAPMAVPRTYHSVAILLQDGRVLTGGGGLCGSCTQNGAPLNHPDVEIFSPPYLFDADGNLADRPEIYSCPVTADYHKPITVKTSCTISSFALVRFSSPTHSTNNEQRRIPVSFQKQGVNTYEVNIPGRNLLPPGYYMLFAMNNAGVPSVASNLLVGSATPLSELEYPDAPCIISKADWSLQYVDSEQLTVEPGNGTNAFDGLPFTFWHTEWVSQSPPPPHEIQINMGAVYDVNGFQYLPRSVGVNGTIKDFEFYISMDGVNWGSPISSGTFSANTNLKERTFNAVAGQYIRLRALSEINNNPWTCVAEINVLGDYCNPGLNMQTITFDAVPNQATSGAPFAISATASSGLPVSLNIIEGPAILNGNTVTLTGLPGKVTIRAEQPGNSQYEAAPAVRQTFLVSDPGCPVLDFSASTINSYGSGQDAGIAETSDDGTSVYLTNNAWKYIDFSYTLTSNSILAFEFFSDREGEYQAIGFDNNNSWNTANAFQLYGTEDMSGDIEAFATYAGDGYQTYIIPVGTYYTGAMDRLFFLADHDAAPANGTAYFRNVRVYEAGDCTGFQPTQVKLKVMLEGPWLGNEMSTALNINGLLPQWQPYDDNPWNYQGEECLDIFPADCVDWVLVNLRDPNDSSNILYQRTCLLRKDGTLIDTDGSEVINFGRTGLTSGFISVHHRNHLGVMTQAPVLFD